MKKDVVCPGCETVFPIRPEMAGNTYRCKNCSSIIKVPRDLFGIAIGDRADKDKSYFSAPGVSVTRSRFVVEGQTYVVSNITSVKYFEKIPERGGPILFGVFGLVLCFLGLNWQSLYPAFIGLFCIIIAGVQWHSQNTEYSVVLTTAGGEIKALTNEDSDFIAAVVEALNQAIIDRG
jgi:hypothetical protein